VIRAAVFDFDGVILDSNAVKEGAFFAAVAEVYPGEEELVASLIDPRHPLTRQRFMAKVAERLAPVGERGDVALDLTARYGRIVNEGLKEALFIPGAKEALETLAARAPLYLNTQNPRDAIVPILEARGVAHLFTAVYGSERSKSENLRAIMEDGYAPDELVMIGDGILDWEAARDLNVAFIAVNPAFDTDSSPPVATLTDLTGLVGVIDRLNR
jgi:phosphoglycolate phosphatase-like HAD superfamily hydrolase